MKAIKNIVLHSTAKTHIDEIRQTNKYLVSKVCEVLGWKEDQYCQHQFEQYTAFVESVFVRSPSLAKQVLYSPVMRGFWNNEASLRNELEFLPFAISASATTFINEIGCIYHAEPTCIDVLQEYLYRHHPLTLKFDEEFMRKCNRVLDTIRKGQSC